MTSLLEVPVSSRFHGPDFVNGPSLPTKPNASHHHVCFKLLSSWDFSEWFELQCLHSYSAKWLRQLFFWNVATEGGSGPLKCRTCLLAFASVLTWTPHFFRKNVCLLKIFCWKGWSNTDISLINPCGEIPTAAFWTISSFKELWVFVYFHICHGYAQTPMPSRKFYLQFCPFFVLTTGCRGWWSLSCQSRLLAGKIFTPLTELSDCCPQTKWAHMLNFPPTD